MERPETIERNIKIYREYKNKKKTAIGLAYDFGITRQRVYEIINIVEKEISEAEDVFKANASVVYPAIRKFLNERRMKMSDLCRSLGVDAGAHSAVRSFLTGKTKGNIEIIENILMLTKMDFYEAFNFPKDYMKEESPYMINNNFMENL